MKFLSNLQMALVTATDVAESEPVKIAVNAITWVATALMIIGAVLVTMNLIKTGIAMSNADSPEAAQKCKKRIIYCVVGLVLIVCATVAVQVLKSFVIEWMTGQGLDTSKVK